MLVVLVMLGAVGSVDAGDAVGAVDEVGTAPAPAHGAVRVGSATAGLGIALLATATTLPVLGAALAVWAWQDGIHRSSFSSSLASGMFGLTIAAVVGCGLLFALPIGAYLGHLAGGGSGSFGTAMLGMLAGLAVGGSAMLGGAMLLGDQAQWRPTAGVLMGVGALLFLAAPVIALELHHAKVSLAPVPGGAVATLGGTF